MVNPHIFRHSHRKKLCLYLYILIYTNIYLNNISMISYPWNFPMQWSVSPCFFFEIPFFRWTLWTPHESPASESVACLHSEMLGLLDAPESARPAMWRFQASGDQWGRYNSPIYIIYIMHIPGIFQESPRALFATSRPTGLKSMLGSKLCSWKVGEPLGEGSGYGGPFIKHHGFSPKNGEKNHGSGLRKKNAS
jgi:hypothetical protein